MGLGQLTLLCVFCGCFTFCSASVGCENETQISYTKALQDGLVESRGRHRLQLLFPLLLRISTRLATLVPTALMGLLGIILFVVFSKKAFIISLFALFLSLSGKFKGKDDIHIHKVNSYPDYNGEEHIHYHHREPLKFNKQYHGGNRPYKMWKKYIRRTFPSSPHISSSEFWYNDDNIQPFKPFKPLPSHFKIRTHLENDLNVENSHRHFLHTKYGEKNSGFAQLQR